MKTHINMVGGGIQHDVCSSALNKNKFVEWDKDLSRPASISVHIDDGLFFEANKNKKNYGWIVESSAIVPGIINTVLSNLEYFKEKFTYIFTHDRRIVATDPSFFKFVLPAAKPWIQNKQIYKKNKLASFIGSNKTMCAGHMFRQEMIKKYEKVLDHYGRGFGKKELPWIFNENGIEESGKLIALKDYMFSIAMENDNYDDIFCEKITDCFATGTIPIFWGTKNIVNYFDANGILFLENLTDISLLNEDFYMSKLESIKNNLEIVLKLDTVEDYFFINYIK